MLEPKNDRQKAIRLQLARLRLSHVEPEDLNEGEIEDGLHMLSEARAIFREEQAGDPSDRLEKIKEAERQINAEKEAATARMIAANKAMMAEGIAHAEAVAKIPQRWSLVPSDKLAEVRSEIALRASVVQALATCGHDYVDARFSGYWDELNESQGPELLRLLARERELMTKSEPEGGAK